MKISTAATELEILACYNTPNHYLRLSFDGSIVHLSVKEVRQVSEELRLWLSAFDRKELASQYEDKKP